MHLSRRHKAIFFDQHTMPPGDGKRYPYPASRLPDAPPGTEG